MASPTYLILGATGGMGQALCERLSKRGASLLIGGRDPVRLEELSKRTGAEFLAGDARETRWPSIGPSLARPSASAGSTVP